VKDKEKYFEIVYSAYAKSIFRFCVLRLNDTTLAEDITEETFVRIWKLISEEKKIDNEKSFVYLIARGLIVDYYRSAKNKKDVSIEKYNFDFSYDESIVDRVDLQQQIEEVYAKLKKIKKEYQEIIVLHYVEDLKIAEVAKVLGKTENSTRVLLHRALAAVKKHYE
jgi:RNA polymerase sigma-70 factor (ECF subfamily)